MRSTLTEKTESVMVDGWASQEIGDGVENKSKTGTLVAVVSDKGTVGAERTRVDESGAHDEHNQDHYARDAEI